MLKEHAKTKKDLIYYFLHTDSDEVRSVVALADNLEQAMKQNLNGKELALVLYHATLKAKNGIYGEDTKSAFREIESHLQRWTDKALSQTHTFTHYNFSHVMHTFHLLEIKPPQRLIDKGLELAHEFIPEFNADDMSYFLESFAKLAIPLPKKAINLLQKKMPLVAGSFSSFQAFNLLHSMAMIDAVNSQHFGTGKASFSQIFSETIKNARFRAKLAEPNDIAEINMLADALLWFKGETTISRIEQPDTVSLFEGDVRDNLKKAGAAIGKETVIAKLKHRVDLTAAFNDTSILIECDGPSHFIRSADDHKVYMNGQTILQTGLIQKAQPGQHIVRIPHDVFYQHMNDQDFWESFLITVDDTQAGAYILDNNGLIELVAGKHPALQNE